MAAGCSPQHHPSVIVRSLTSSRQPSYESEDVVHSMPLDYHQNRPTAQVKPAILHQPDKPEQNAGCEAMQLQRLHAQLKCDGRITMRKYRKLSVAEKLEVLRLVDNKKSYSFITATLGIARSTISDIVRRRELLVGATDLSSPLPPKRMSRFSEINEHMMQHIADCQAENIRVKSSTVRRVAKRYATSIGVEEFRASKGWYTRLQKRLAKLGSTPILYNDDADNFEDDAELSSSSQSPDESDPSEWFVRVQRLMYQLKEVALQKGNQDVQALTLQLEHQFTRIRCQELSEELKLMDGARTEQVDWIRDSGDEEYDNSG